MKRILFLTVVATTFFHFTGFGQRILHSLGTSTSIIFNTHNGNVDNTDFILRQVNVVYFPRYNFIEKENSSVSVGVPLGLGAGFVSDTYSNDTKAYFAFDIPAVIDYNIGLKSTMENSSPFGFYFGLGYSYYNINIGNKNTTGFGAKTFGPLARIGARINISGKDSDDNAAFTIGLFYKKGQESAKLTTIGLNLILDF